MKTHTIRDRLLASTMVGGAALLALTAVPALTLLTPTQAMAQNLVQGAVSGSVSNQANQPVGGASVTLRSVSQGFTRSYTTAADGSFRAVALPQGQYEITINADGYNALTETVSVGAGGTTSLGFTIGQTAAAASGATAVDEIVVVGVRQAVSEFDATTTGLTVNVEELSRNIPVGRDATSIALLAPGVTVSDTAFGAIPTIGGSSAGENTYFINGLNITKFRDFTGSSTVPFEFYQTLETKTGGYQAEFGRGTGGVLNGTTKSGGNEWEFGITGYWEPDSLRSDAPNTYLAQNNFDEAESSDIILDFGGPIIRDRLFIFGLYNWRDRENFNVGSAVANNPDFGAGANATRITSDDPFYGAKVDFLLTDDHRLELTYFSDEQTQLTENLFVNNNGEAIGEYTASEFEFGGANWIARYTGVWTDWLTTSVAYGVNQYDEALTSPGDGCAAITDELPGFPRRGCWGNVQPAFNQDEREVLRADVDIYASLFGDHHFRIGYDAETLTSTQQLDYSGSGYSYCRPGGFANGVACTGEITGGLWYRYQTLFTAANLSNTDGTGYRNPIFLTSNASGTRVAGNPNPNYNPTLAGLTDAQLIGTPSRNRVRAYDNDGGWQSIQNAFYLQDSWEVTDRLTLNLGIRNEGFENSNLDGEAFVDLQNQWAPRLGFTYDVMGDRSSKLFGFYGRYFLPVATNTNTRLAGAEFFISDTWNLDFSGTVAGRPDANRDGMDDVTDEPILYSLRGPGTNADGTLKATATAVDEDIDPMYVDEFIVGYEQQLGDFMGSGDWTFGVKGTYRELGTAIDDVAIDAAVLDYCEAAGGGLSEDVCSTVWYGFHQYVLTNPGEDMAVTISGADLALAQDRTADLADDGFLNGTATSALTYDDRAVVLSAEDLGYPTPDRTYKAVELSLEKAFDGLWGARFSYVWSENKGNYEGALKSDNGQTDPGLSQDFDQPGLTDNSYGFLPNHRAHTFKVFGNWAATEHLNIGANLIIQSPRKFGCVGVHPTDGFAQQYGAASWFCQGVATPRGESFQSTWMKSLDLTFSYDLGSRLDLPGDSLIARADVFNVFNTAGSVDHQEFGDLGSGDANPFYQRVTGYQAPRSVRFSLAYRF